MSTDYRFNTPEGRAYEGGPEKRVTFAYILTALIALFAGFLLGPPQALNYAGINLYDWLPLASYYQGLTLHGVLMGLVFTSFFICGLLLFLPARELGIRPRMGIAWANFWMMLLGTVLAGGAMIANTSNVLYTLYPPLIGHWAFYLGLTLVVVGTLVIAVLVWDLRQSWKAVNPGQPTPLITYMSFVTWIMWGIASLGLAAGVLFLLLPASLGWTQGADPQLFRTLFWFTGHPIVYFWLLPAYVSWYALVPRLAGGKLLSDPMARLVFVLFLLFSIPVGFHHQYADPGIPMAWKLVHNLLTMFVAIPSLITAFTIAASLENAGRARGGRGIVGWIPVLPWREPAFTAQVLAMVTFIFGGAGGIVLATMNLNLMVHNTAFIPGHFHITVGTAVTMTFMGITFWLLPHLTGRPLRAGRAALLSVWGWFIGMMLFALGQHWQGILGVPRRAHISDLRPDLADTYANAALPAVFTGVGGVVLLVAGVLFFWSLAATLLGRRSATEPPAAESSETLSGPWAADGRPKRGVMIMDRLLPWSLLAIVIVVFAYAPMIIDQVANSVPIPTMQLW